MESIEQTSDGNGLDVDEGQSMVKYDANFCRYTLHQVAVGLAKMHSRKVIHRDIKSDNILCSEDGRVKVADLGFSTAQEKRRRKRELVGTKSFMPPEILKGKKHNEKVDVWSFGCFAYELATGMPPFGDIDNESARMGKILYEKIPPIDIDIWKD